MAGEPESLSTDEPLAERIERHDFNRLIMLSDGVFAIAITLLALDMKLPEQWDGSLGGLAYGAGRSLVGYIFAFLLVGAFWMAHRRMFAKFVRVDRIATLLNVLVLGFIGLAPFVARLIAEKGRRGRSPSISSSPVRSSPAMPRSTPTAASGGSCITKSAASVFAARRSALRSAP
jgi:uncharacterized membrane protein